MSARRRSLDMDAAVLLPQPALHGVAAWMFAALLVCGGTFATFGTYTRHESVKGRVVASGGFSAVVTEQPGTIAQIDVKLEQPVRAGQVLATIRLPPVVGKSGDRAATDIGRLKVVRDNLSRQEEATGLAIREDAVQIKEIVSNSMASLQSLRQIRNAAKSQGEMARERLGAFAELERAGFVTKTQLDQARASSLQVSEGIYNNELTETEIARARQDRINSVRSEIRGLQQALLNIQNQRIQVDVQIHDFEVQQFVKIVSPSDGYLSALNVRIGSRVESGDRLFGVSRKQSEFVVSTDVPSKAMGFIERGQRVLLKYDTFPFEVFGARYGVVTSVQDVSLDNATPSPADGKDDRHFTVEIKPDEPFVLAYGSRRPLRIGMGVTAEIALEKRTFLSWFLDPLLAVRGNIG